MSDPVGDYKWHLFVIMAAIGWIFCLLQILGIISFCRLRGLLIIQKRYPRLIIFEAIVSCFMLSVVYPANSTFYYSIPVTSTTWWQYLRIGLVTYTLPIPVVTEACRIWLISYDLQYLHSSKNQQWKTVIDLSYAKRNWYLQNRGRWGNETYVARVAFIYYIVTSTAIYTAIWLTMEPMFTPHNEPMAISVGNIAPFIVPVCILIYLYISTPRKLQDQFLFQYEFKLTAIVTITAMSVPMACVPVMSLFPQSITAGYTLLSVIVILQHVPSLMSTLWIPCKIKTMTQWNSSSKSQRERAVSGDFRQDLQETLNDEHKCEAFVDWMYREFSSETILSFLEFVQFKKYIKEKIEKIDEIGVSAGTDRYDFDLYDGMPRSTIVYDTWSFVHIGEGSVLSGGNVLSLSAVVQSASSPTENPLLRTKRIAHLLFRKYIDYHAELEINISGSLRNKYVHLDQTNYEGMQLEQFLTLHDDLMFEMMKYQSQSYRRSVSGSSNTT